MESRLYYVTVRGAGKTGFLLGPYPTHQEALNNVTLGRDLAVAADDRAWFYSFGTVSLPVDGKQPRVVFADKMEASA